MSLEPTVTPQNKILEIFVSVWIVFYGCCIVNLDIIYVDMYGQREICHFRLLLCNSFISQFVHPVWGERKRQSRWMGSKYFHQLRVSFYYENLVQHPSNYTSIIVNISDLHYFVWSFNDIGGFLHLCVFLI